MLCLTLNSSHRSHTFLYVRAHHHAQAVTKLHIPSLSLSLSRFSMNHLSPSYVYPSHPTASTYISVGPIDYFLHVELSPIQLPLNPPLGVATPRYRATISTLHRRVTLALPLNPLSTICTP